MDVQQQAEAIFTAVNASFSKESDETMRQLWDSLMNRVNYQIQLSEEDYIAHNDKMAAQFLPRNVQ